MHNVEITNIYKNNIEYRPLKRKRVNFKTYSILLILIIPILALGSLKLYSNSSLEDIYINVCNLYNPIYSPYAETGSITFASNIYFETDLSDLDMPILSSEVSIDDSGTISAKVKESILVKSVADGVVESIKDTDGVKIVKIAYSDTISVEYINLDVLGVSEGNIVKRGKEIGTAKLGSVVQFRAYLGKNQIKGLKIKNNKIVWQS